MMHPDPNAAPSPKPLELEDPLLVAAAMLFNQRQFHEVTVEEAARRAGVNVEEARRRYPSAAYLARGIYEAVLDKIPEHVAAQGPTGTLHDNLCAIVIAEMQLLQPYTTFVKRSILEFLNPTSIQLLLQVPTMQRLLSHVSEQIAVARRTGMVGPWVIPNVAAMMFGALHAKLITYWLTFDTTSTGSKTLAMLDRDIGKFVKLLQNPLGCLNLGVFSAAPAPVTYNYKTAPTAGSASRKGKDKKPQS